ERGGGSRPRAYPPPGFCAHHRGAPGDLAEGAVSAIGTAILLRELYPRVLAKTLSLTKNLPDAEDAVHDAIERALASWSEREMPDTPEAWLVTVAGNAHRDRLRRRKREDLRGDALETLAALSPWARIAVAEPEIAR